MVNVWLLSLIQSTTKAGNNKLYRVLGGGLLMSPYLLLDDGNRYF